MSYDEEERRRSRVVVETPTARREVVHSQTVRQPEHSGYSTGVVAAVALAAIAATAIIFLFLMNRGDNTDSTNVNVRASAQPTPVTQQPVYVPQPAATQSTPIIIQQAPPVTTTQPAPVIITQPPPQVPPAGSAATAPEASVPAALRPSDDRVQEQIERAFSDDPDLAAGDIIAVVVVDGKVTLEGTVKTEELKQRAAKLAQRIKWVRSVDNKLVVAGG